jgi:hypothetical protein
MPVPKGKRYGGVQKGYKAPKTLEKLEAREFTRKMVTDALRPMIQAQIANAQGIGHLYTRDKAGKFTKIENQAQIDQLLKEGSEGEHYWIFSKDPSVQAFTDLLNRALDKPAEQVKVTGEDGGPVEFTFRWKG